jgi:hypothetical protein
MQFVLYFEALGTIVLVWLSPRARYVNRVISSILPFFWLWMAITYYLLFASTINRAAWHFGGVFIMAACLYDRPRHNQMSFLRVRQHAPIGPIQYTHRQFFVEDHKRSTVAANLGLAGLMLCLLPVLCLLPACAGISQDELSSILQPYFPKCCLTVFVRVVAFV